MITRFKAKIDMPYSLHDMVVSKITCHDESVCLEFKHGYMSTKEPYPQVEGHIFIENVDMDCACVLLLSKLGQYGDFTGTKIPLEDFVKKYDAYSFEIIDEMYGFNQVEYIGYLHSPKKIIQLKCRFQCISPAILYMKQKNNI